MFSLPPSPSGSSFSSPSSSAFLPSTSPSESDLVSAIHTLKCSSPNLGVLKVLECLRCQKQWTIGEKRLRKVMKDYGLTLDPSQCHSATAGHASPPSSTALPLPIPIPIPTVSATSPSSIATNLQALTRSHPTSGPSPRNRGRARAPKPLVAVASTSAAASASAIAAAERDQDAWLPGGLKRVKIHLDLLPSLSGPSGRTHIFPCIKLHVMEDTLTGAPYVLAPEVCRAIWSKLDARDAHLAHSIYSPAPHRCWVEDPEHNEGEPRLLGCPQGLRRQRATFLGRRGDTEKIWVFPASNSPNEPSPSSITSPSSSPISETGKRKMGSATTPVTREIHIELGAECHSDSPSKNPNPVVGKGKGKAVQTSSKIVTMKADDLVKITLDH